MRCAAACNGWADSLQLRPWHAIHTADSHAASTLNNTSYVAGRRHTHTAVMPQLYKLTCIVHACYHEIVQSRDVARPAAL